MKSLLRKVSWSVRHRLLPVLLMLLPLWPGIVITAVSLKVEEHYPFSHFPMYDSFSESTFYVYVTDGQDNPVAVESLTYNRTTRLKKIFDDALESKRLELDKRQIEMTPGELRPAGEYTLNWLVENSPDHGQRALREIGTLRFYQVYITVADGEVTELEHERIAEIEVPPLEES